MKERPILMNGAMVRAILEGRKTQTRRIVKNVSGHPQLLRDGSTRIVDCIRDVDGGPSALMYAPNNWECCPYGVPGDRLWIRETFCTVDDREHGGNLWYDYRATPRYSASHPAGWDNEPDHPDALKWTPSIHMPRAASRITLEIIGVRVERLNDISEIDAIAEGTPGGHGAIPRYTYAAATPVEQYRWLWESINGAGSWNVNPWVWCIDFKRVKNDY